MRKIVIHRAGGYDRLKLEEHPDPPLGPGEVRVDVAASGVNFADVVIRMGLYSSAKEYVGWPITPGFEFAGKVAELGEGVDDLLLGEEVFGVSRFGAYADQVVVPRHQLLRRPEGMALEQAAGFPTIFLTAYYAVHELVHPRPGQTALVHSAAGGVGSALTQLCRLAGCQVTGVVGAAHKLEAVRELGAEAVIDRSAGGLWQAIERQAPDGFDAIYDSSGPSTLRQGFRHLAPAGKLVVYGHHTFFRKGGRGKPSWIKMALQYLRMPRFNPLDLTDQNKSVLAFNLSYLFHRADLLAEAMERLLGWLEAGEIAPPTVTTYPLAEAARAHRELESGQTVGKLVLLC